MKVAAVVSTKGGPGKTTVGANLGAFCTDAGVRTLLIDLDDQPSLSSFYNLSHEAPDGVISYMTNASVQSTFSPVKAVDLNLLTLPLLARSMN